MQTTIDDLLGDGQAQTPEVAPETRPNPDDQESGIEPSGAPPAAAAPAPEAVPFDVERATAEVTELRQRVSQVRAELEHLEALLHTAEVELVQNTPEPTLQEVNEYMRRLDAEGQAERIELKSILRSRGMLRGRRGAHPPLFTV